MPPFKKLKTGEKTFKDSKPSIDSDLDNGRDWRADCYGIRDINNYALRKNILTDVTFYVGADKEVFHAHRLILGLGSPVFEAMFYGPLAEKGDTITIPDVDPEGFQHLLKFLYSEHTVLNDEIAAIKTAFAADKYCISSLKRFCENFLYNNELTTANVWMLLQNSIYLNLNDLKVKCLFFLKKNTESSFQHCNFLDVNTNTLETILCRNCFAESMPERKILQYIMHWAYHNSNHDEKDSFKNTLTPLLKYIYFDSLEAKEFVNFLEVRKLNEVLGSDDALAILKHILLPALCPLPNWCTRIKRAPLYFTPQKVASDSSKSITLTCLLKSPRSHESQSTSSSESSSSGVHVRSSIIYSDSTPSISSSSSSSSSSDFSD